MAKKSLQKSLHLYLSKLKKYQTSNYNLCNYKTVPPPISVASIDHGATLADVDRYIFENFNSLYSPRCNPSGLVPYNPLEFSPRFTDPPPDVIRASKRFFVTVGPTGSLVEEARLSGRSSSASTSSRRRSSVAGSEGKAVVTVSADPYVDFRQSMQDMVDARHVDKFGPLDWGFLEDLLTCYLELNEKSVHDCILRAFMDLTEELRRQRSEVRRRRRKVRNGKTA